MHDVAQLLLRAQLREGVPLGQLRHQLPQSVAFHVIRPELRNRQEPLSAPTVPERCTSRHRARAAKTTTVCLTQHRLPQSIALHVIRPKLRNAQVCPC